MSTKLGTVDRLAITKAEFDVLEAAAHMRRTIGGALKTNRHFRKKHAMKCVAKGWLREVQCVLVDGDGYHVEPEREGIGYELTLEGIKALADVRTHLGQDAYPRGAR